MEQGRKKRAALCANASAGGDKCAKEEGVPQTTGAERGDQHVARRVSGEQTCSRRC